VWTEDWSDPDWSVTIGLDSGGDVRAAVRDLADWLAPWDVIDQDAYDDICEAKFVAASPAA
jgi:hypothetical protein